MIDQVRLQALIKKQVQLEFDCFIELLSIENKANNTKVIMTDKALESILIYCIKLNLKEKIYEQSNFKNVPRPVKKDRKQMCFNV